MPDAIDLKEIAGQVETHYQVALSGEVALLNERDGQYVVKIGVKDGKALTVRLCPADRSYARVMADIAALQLLNGASVPAPVFRPTIAGKKTWMWQEGCWAYALDFIDGRHPEMTLPLLETLANMLARAHLLLDRNSNYPNRVYWLGELPLSIGRAETAGQHPKWGRQAREVAANLMSLPDLRGLPLGLCHTDIHEGNMLLTRDNQLYLIDWEDAGLGEVLFDVALVLGWNCVWPKEDQANVFGNKGQPEMYNFDEEYSTHFLRHYQQVRPLAPIEVEKLGAAIRFVMGWFAARDIEREIIEPGISAGLAFTNWAIMRSVTPEWDQQLARWARQTAG